MSHANAGSPASALSSQLLEISSTHDPEAPDAATQVHHEGDGSIEPDAKHNKEEETRGVASSLRSAILMPVEEASDSEDDKKLFQCPHCDKSYALEKSLKRHLSDRKSVCFRNRDSKPVEGPTQWVCNRCRAPFARRFSVERHIEGSCWKICDGCTESNSKICDANLVDGACTTCVQANKSSCTKHEGPVPGSAPVLLAGPPSEQKDADSNIRSIANSVASAKRSKRRAVESPDASPQSKPKRKTRSARREGEAGHRSSSEIRGAIQSEFDLGSDVKVYSATPQRSPPVMLPSQPPRDQVNLLGRNLLPPFDANIQNDRVTCQSQDLILSDNGQVFSKIQPGQFLSHVPPRILTDNSMEIAPDTQYVPSMQEMLQRQQRAVLSMGMASQHGGRYVAYPQHSAPVSELRTSLNMESSGWGPLQQRTFGSGNALESLPNNFQVHQDLSFDQLNGSNHSMLGISALNSPNDSRRSSFVNVEHIEGGDFMLPPPSVPNSRAASLHSSTARGPLSAPVSRMPSQQPSRQSSMEHVPARHGSNFNPISEQNHDASQSRLMVRLPLPRELKFELALKPPSGDKVDPSNPPLCIRIHSNTYDDNGDAIFSILSILPSEPFGPGLDYYCQQRGKRFGIDWKFIYKYPAPTKEKHDRKRYLDLTWNVKPSMVTDKEYPGHAIRDGDTIFVVNRRTPVDVKADEIGAQVRAQRVHIQAGETLVWQKRDTNATWYKNADKTLQAARNEVAELISLIGKLKNAQIQRENQIAQVLTRSAQVQNENAMLRQAKVSRSGQFGQQAVPQQHQQMPVQPHQHMSPYRAGKVASQQKQVDQFPGQGHNQHFGKDQYPGQSQNQHRGQNHLSVYPLADTILAHQPHNMYNAYPPIHNYQVPNIRGPCGTRRLGLAREMAGKTAAEKEGKEEE